MEPETAHTNARPKPARTSQSATPHVWLLGCGNMGSAMLAGWRKHLESGSPDGSNRDSAGESDHCPSPRTSCQPFTLVAIDPDPAGQRRARDLGFLAVASVADLASRPPPILVILAVKPQAITTLVQRIRQQINGNSLIVSLAAGVTIGEIARQLPASAGIVRIMPNLPVAVGAGMIAGVRSPSVSKEQTLQLESLLGPLGEFAWLAEESQLDAVTAISGSGPAYVYLFAEALREAGCKLGLSRDLAERLARQTLHGAARQILANPDKHLESMREDVTSPGGTTHAALTIFLRNHQLESLVLEATRAACARAGALRFPVDSKDLDSDTR